MCAEVVVLRLGHRKGRDPRITTHLGLVARAFGANRFILAGDEDDELFSGLQSVSESFGGRLLTEHTEKPMKWLKEFTKNGTAVHLTMYGLPFRQVVPSLSTDQPLCVVVGGAKVPRQVYDICQHNLAVGNQPHSEVAALALFLDSFIEDVPQFADARLSIEPNARGKSVLDRDESE
ncbi:MAG: hypothetical protein QF707_02970 [Candidatus Poseidoniaceae archaeon]|nr:hypothetical protein [Candidatus Poseidoniaceae archaeon]